MAKALARTLGDAATYRQLLKAEALKQFDGDYDVLYRAFAAQQPGFGQRMDELVAGSKSGQPLTGMTDVLAHVPNLNISVPVNIDKWDAGSFSPLVVFIPADYDEKNYPKPLQAYDKDGQVHLLDTKKAPDYPVVAVGPSERVKGTDLTSEYYGPGKGTYGEGKQANGVIGGKGTNRPLPDPEPFPDPYYPPPTPPSTPPQYYRTCRTDNQTEYLRSLWMKDVSVYEDWVLGGPDIRLQILASSGAVTGAGTIYDGKYGDLVKYVWTEEDPGFPGKVETTLEYTLPGGGKASVKVTFEKGAFDDLIGQKDVSFDSCPDPTKDYYSLGGGTSEFRWSLQNRP